MSESNQQYQKLIERSLSRIEMFGINPLGEFRKIRGTIFIITMFTYVFLSIQLVVIKEDRDISDYGNILETGNYFIAMMVKSLCMVGKRNKLKKLIEYTKQFKYYEEKLPRNLRIVRFFELVYVILLTGTAVAYCVKGFLTHDTPIPMHVPEFLPNHFKHLFQYYMTFIYFVSVRAGNAVDPFFIYIFIMLSLQYRYISEKIRALKFDKENWKSCQQEIKEITDYHNFLMDVLDLVNDVNGISIFACVFCTELLICGELVLISKIEMEPETVIPHICASSFWVFITTLYAWGSSKIAEEAEGICLACYESDWYTCENTEIKKELILIMIKAQRFPGIQAWKFFTYDMETCTLVFKSSISFFSCIHSMEA